jgi:hypothetical protein
MANQLSAACLSFFKSRNSAKSKPLNAPRDEKKNNKCEEALMVNELVVFIYYLKRGLA